MSNPFCLKGDIISFTAYPLTCCSSATGATQAWSLGFHFETPIIYVTSLKFEDNGLNFRYAPSAFQI